MIFLKFYVPGERMKFVVFSDPRKQETYVALLYLPPSSTNMSLLYFCLLTHNAETSFKIYKHKKCNVEFLTTINSTMDGYYRFFFSLIHSDQRCFSWGYYFRMLLFYFRKSSDILRKISPNSDIQLPIYTLDQGFSIDGKINHIGFIDLVS